MHSDLHGGNVLIEHDTGIVSPMYTVFEVDGSVHPDYLYAVLKSESSLQLYQRLGQGSVNRRASIGFKTLERVTLRHPPLAEQRKIATLTRSISASLCSSACEWGSWGLPRSVEYIPKRDCMLDHLASFVRPGDTVITMGAGDIGSLGDAFLSRIETVRQAG